MQADTKILGKKPKLRTKINAKCKECIYDPYAAGSWRKQVEYCTSYKCPLYSVRPVRINNVGGE